MKKDVLKSPLRDFHISPLPDLTTRNISVPLGTGKIVALIGSRPYRYFKGLLLSVRLTVAASYSKASGHL